MPSLLDPVRSTDLLARRPPRKKLNYLLLQYFWTAFNPHRLSGLFSVISCEVPKRKAQVYQVDSS